MSDGRLPPEVARQAAEWFLLLQSGAATAAECTAFERWRSSDPQHERAWERAERIGGRLGQIPATIGMPVLRRGEGIDRRQALKALAGLVALPPVAWLAWRELPWRHWAADTRTGIGERRELELADGGWLQLNTATAVDVRYDAAARTVHLHQGEILVQTAPDRAEPARPFRVETREGSVRALGTRFLVRRGEADTQVTVLAHAVEIRPSHAPHGQRVGEGQRAVFTATQVGPPAPAAVEADAWSRGILYADGMRLEDFLAELGRYRPGILRCHPAVAELRVSGAFQLGDTGPVLRSLARALPVQVVHRTRWWISVEPAAG